jgi:hypothetical protein
MSAVFLNKFLTSRQNLCATLPGHKLREESKMNSMIDTKQWVCIRWDMIKGHYFVGPFADAHEAEDWAVENQGTDIRWQIKHLDPNVALDVRAPGEMPELEPDPKEPDQWTERQSDGPHAAFFLLMIYSDPLHLVGPFPDHRHAYFWAVAYQARTDDEGLEVLWLNDPAVPARLLTPAEGVAEGARSDAEWRREAAAMGLPVMG